MRRHSSHFQMAHLASLGLIVDIVWQFRLPTNSGLFDDGLLI